MWCPSCKADVAAEVAADNRRVRCATCGTEISASTAFTGLAKTREARDLLERWASERKSDPVPSRSERPQTAASASGATAIGGVNLEAEVTPLPSRSRGEPISERVPADAFGGTYHTDSASSSTYRTDAPQQLAGPAGGESRRPQPAGRTSGRRGAVPDSGYPAGSSPYPAVGRQETVRLHREHESAERSPHFDIQGSLVANERKKTNWTLVVGQLVAYAGVAMLTVGTTLIVWSYFGGPASYAPTGWLTTTAGQMLLFLGVVTLVSGGMEQTTEEVRTRIERLGERIIRIEQIARDQALRGPYIPAEYFERTGEAPMDADVRSTVGIRQ